MAKQTKRMKAATRSTEWRAALGDDRVVRYNGGMILTSHPTRSTCPAPDLLSVVKSVRLVLYAYDGVRRREGYGPNPELTQCIRDVEAAIAMAEES